MPIYDTTQELEQKKVGTLDSSGADGYLADLDAKRKADQANNPYESISGSGNNQVLNKNQQNQTDSDRMLAGLEPLRGANTFNDRALSAAAPAQSKENERFTDEQKVVQKQQASQSATLNASQYRMGQAGSSYAASATADLQEQHDLQNKQLAQQHTDALNAAWDAALRGNIAQADTFSKQAEAIKTRIEQQRVQQGEDQVKSLQAQKLAVDLGEKWLEGLATKASASGVEPSEVEFSTLDKTLGMNPGSAKTLYGIQRRAVEDKDIARAKEEFGMYTAQTAEQRAQSGEDRAQGKFGMDSVAFAADQKAKKVQLANDFATFLGKSEEGGSYVVDGRTYTVTGKAPDMVWGGESDENGQTIEWSIDKQTGETIIYPLGIFPRSKAWTTIQDKNGDPWRFNAETGQAMPYSASEGQKSYGLVAQDQKTGLTLPGHEANAGQCGAFNNYCYGEAILGDSLTQKKQVLSQYAVDTNDVQVGDTFLMNVGTTGHVGIVNYVNKDAPGGPMVKVTESNYIPPGKGKMSNTRSMLLNDSRLVGFARVPTPNLPAVGSDSKATMAANGNVPNKPVFKGAGAEDKNLTARVPDDIAIASGLPAGATYGDARKAGVTLKTPPTKTADPKSDRVPDDVAIASNLKPGTTYKEAADQGVTLKQPEKSMTPEYLADLRTANPKAGIRLDDTAAQVQEKLDKVANPVFVGKGSSTEDDKPLTDAEKTARGFDLIDPRTTGLTPKTVDAYVATLKAENGGKMPLAPDQESAAQQLANYQGDINEVMKGRTTGEAERINMRVLQINPKWVAGQYKIRQALKENFANGPIGDAISAVTKVVQHLQDLKASSDTVTGHRFLGGYVPGASILGDAAANVTHTAGDLKAYNENAQAVANELTKVFSGSGGNESEVNSWKDTTNDRNTAKENETVIQKSIDLMAGQLKGIYDRYVRTMGTGPEKPLVSQDDIAAIDRLGFDSSKLLKYSLPPLPTGQSYVRNMDTKSVETVSTSDLKFMPKNYTQL